MFVPRPLMLVTSSKQKPALTVSIAVTAPCATPSEMESPLSALPGITELELDDRLAQMGIRAGVVVGETVPSPTKVHVPAPSERTHPMSPLKAREDANKESLEVEKVVDTEKDRNQRGPSWDPWEPTVPVNAILNQAQVPRVPPSEVNTPVLPGNLSSSDGDMKMSREEEAPIPNHVLYTHQEDPRLFYESFFSLLGPFEEGPGALYDKLGKSFGFSLAQQFGVPDKLLGFGSFGQVWRSTKDGRLYAFKELRYTAHDEANKRRILNEFDLGFNIHLPSVVQTHKIFASSCFHGLLIIVQDLAPGIDLFLAIQNDHFLNNPLKTDRVFKRIVEAVADIHKAGVCHNDLKPENIIYNPEDESVKLIDLGLAFSLHTPSTERYLLSAGTEPFMPPEHFIAYNVLSRDEDLVRSGSAKDVWSLGVIYYNMVNEGRDPWAVANYDCKNFTNFVHRKSDPDFDSIVRSFTPGRVLDTRAYMRFAALEKMFVVEPVHRPSASRLLKLRWLKCLGKDVCQEYEVGKYSSSEVLEEERL